jgi:hypothetical protein
MVGKMARQEARIGVVSRPEPDTHDETHRLAAIEGGNVLLCERRRTGRQQREGGEEGEEARELFIIGFLAQIIASAAVGPPQSITHAPNVDRARARSSSGFSGRVT